MAEGSPRYLRLVATGRLQLAVMVGVVVCFLVTMGFAQLEVWASNGSIRAIVEEVTPTVETLAAVNVALRHYTFDLIRYALSPVAERPALVPGLDASAAELHASVASYRGLETLPFERAADATLDRDLGALEQAALKVRGAARRGRGIPSAELLDVRQRANDVGFTISRLIDLNSTRGAELGLEIETSRKRSLVAEIALGTLSVVLALLATFFAAALTRESTKWFEARTRELERRAQELERFSSRVAHDVLSPLNTVGLALQLADRQYTLDERARPLLARGMASLGRVQKLVDGLLDFALAGAHPKPGARAAVPDVIDEVIETSAPSAAARGISLDVAPLPSPCPDVACHAGVLTSVLGNLVGNAIKYLGEGGERRVEVRVQERGDRLRFEVEDTGPGVPEAIRPFIFEPYVRGADTGQPGLGLGLATVRRLVEAHGGSVGLRSPDRGGSCFWFELPEAREDRPPAPPPSAEAGMPQNP